ncbi:MAG: pyridoxal 5'-phosphate synthase glutaminase subunit PdxT, partial [Bifidobacterium choerinum]
GMILLARRLENDANVYFGALDATVRRNAYGRQLGSFAAEETIHTFDAQGEPSGEIADFPLVFIRGPFVAEVGPDARVMASTRGNAVALQQGNIIATAFHPEITDDRRIHEYFLSL